MVSTSRGRDRSLDFDEGGWQVVGSRVFETFRQAPVSVFFHVRDTLGAIFGSHRREWLQRTQVQFQRGGFKALPLRSGEATAPGFRSRFFFYQVEPATKRWPADNVPPLEKIEAFGKERNLSVLEIAVAWLLAQPGVTSVMAGATR